MHCLFHSEIDLTLSSLETLAKVFDHPSCSLTPPKAQVPIQIIAFPKWQPSAVSYEGLEGLLCSHTQTHFAVFAVFLEQESWDGDWQLDV